VEALLDDIIDPTIVRDAVDLSLSILRGEGAGAADALDRLDAEITKVTRERDYLVTAISAGESVSGVLDVLRALESRQGRLKADQRRSSRSGASVPGRRHRLELGA
jgi:hypothetical protein